MSKIVAIILGILASLVAFLPFGNPVSKLIVTKNTELYIEENYGDKDYVVEETAYDFKTGNYYVHIKSPSSPDSSFTVYADTKGKIDYDTYESAVVKKWNTAGRIDDAYRKAVDAVLESGKIPYDIDFGFGEIAFRESDAQVGEDIPDYAISTDELVLDGEYDTAEMGRKAGKLTVYFYDENVTAQRLAEILLALKKAADEEGLCFKAIDCVLQHPQTEDEASRQDEYFSVEGFMYEDIYEDGLVDRVKENAEQVRMKHLLLDAEKSEQKEIALR